MRFTRRILWARLSKRAVRNRTGAFNCQSVPPSTNAYEFEIGLIHAVSLVFLSGRQLLHSSYSSAAIAEFNAKVKGRQGAS